MHGGTFVTVINCMDGRTQIAVNEYLRDKYNVDFVDTITEPGPNGILAENNDQQAIDSIKKRIDISVNKHGSKHIAIVGHHDCAGNPVDEKTQKEHIISAVKTVESWDYDCEVVGLWVDDNWKVNLVE